MKKLSITLGIIFLLAPSIIGATSGIAFDGNCNGGGTTSASCTVTCVGTNTMILAAVSIDTGSVSSITAGGNAMTLVNSTSNVGIIESLYYYNGLSGSNSISVSTSGNGTHVAAACYSNVKQIAPEANNINTATATSITDAVTTITNNAWTVMATGNNQTNISMTSGTGATIRDQNASAQITASAISDSNGAITPPQSYSQTINMSSGSARMADIIASVVPLNSNSFQLWAMHIF